MQDEAALRMAIDSRIITVNSINYKQIEPGKSNLPSRSPSIAVSCVCALPAVADPIPFHYSLR